MNRNKKEKHMNSRSLGSNKSSWREKRFKISKVSGGRFIFVLYQSQISGCVCVGEGDN